ncbi:hypothetical protein PR202_gb06681 [Eleusine coracana subsp. coracana]|uniref:Uncharacterized protein n=1 Tax=Eleusine coracana subsp. coracana TaxID=191504 RepID=A0AAV5E8F6_ELECO|nr:hypothetical protein PR202_gb06681 [Eleusine coracana subsp. coracana]
MKSVDATAGDHLGRHAYPLGDDVEPWRGFRKVDPDRWEFAHVSFLRGQTHLLRHIARRSSGGGGGKRGKDDDDGATVAMEVVRLKREQRAIEDRVAAMWRRVQETERRPKQMLAFLVKVASSSTSDGASGGFVAASPGTAADGGAEIVKRPRLLLDGDAAAGRGHAAAEGMAFCADDAVDLAGFYAAEDVGFGDGEGGFPPPPPFAFPVDSTTGY